MAVKIPKANTQTSAGLTPATRINIESNANWRDPGIEAIADAVSEIGSTVGTAALRAKENKETGMVNAYTNEAQRRAQNRYLNMTQDLKYKGYGAENFVNDFRNGFYEDLADLEANGFTNADGTPMPALDKELFARVRNAMDTKLISYDNQGFMYAADEIAKRETNDYNTAITLESQAVVNTDDPIQQEINIRNMKSLNTAYMKNRMNDEGLEIMTREQAATALKTYVQNVGAKDPYMGLVVMKDNPNITKYDVKLAEERATFIKTASEIAGMNDALIENGQDTVPQSWNDEMIRPYLTEEEYASYGVARGENAMKKSAAIANDVRVAKNTNNISLMADLADIETQEDMNTLIEKAVLSSDNMSSLDTIKIVNDTKQLNLMYNDAVDFSDRYTDVDGNFNETMAKLEAGMLIASNPLYRDLSEEQKQKITDKFVEQQRVKYMVADTMVRKQNDMRIDSANLYNEFLASLNTAESPIVPQDIKGFEQMSYQDRQSASRLLQEFMKLRKEADKLKKNEGDSFDLNNIALEAYKAMGEKYSLDKDNGINEGDNYKFTEFNKRFQNLYLKKYNMLQARPSEEELRAIAIEAYNSSYKTPESISAFGNALRIEAASQYDRVASVSDMRLAIADILDRGFFSRMFNDKDSLYTKSSSKVLDDVREIYSVATPQQKAIIVDAIARGDDSLIDRIVNNKKVN